MVRIVKVSAFFDGEDNALLDLVDVACLSTDTKPTAGIATGSVCIEADTGNVFIFDEESGDWVEQFSLQG